MSAQLDMFDIATGNSVKPIKAVQGKAITNIEKVYGYRRNGAYKFQFFVKCTITGNEHKDIATIIKLSRKEAKRLNKKHKFYHSEKMKHFSIDSERHGKITFDL